MSPGAPARLVKNLSQLFDKFGTSKYFLPRPTEHAPPKMQFQRIVVSGSSDPRNGRSAVAREKPKENLQNEAAT
jgi:hypothetical protein